MTDRKVSQNVLVSGIVFSMFLWGLSWPSGKVLTGYCTVINFSVYRYILVVLTMVVLLLSLRISFRIRNKGIPALLISGVLLAAYSFFFFKGLKTGSAGAGGVLVTIMNPIMAYTIGLLLSKRLPSRNESIGLALGITAGCVLLKLWDNTAALLDSGNLYFLLAAFTWAVMSKFTAKGAQHGSSIGFSTWQYLITLLCLLPFTDFQEMNAAMSIKDKVFWLNLVFSSVIVTAGATTVYFYTTTRLGAEKASSFIFLVPLCAAISSWLLLGEHIMLHTMVGGVLGIAAVYIINKRKATTRTGS
ncbi:MAG: DMT family transporter [Taibaiella sp.]|nr:DMT family transporter [Taibaiella sp.]